MLTLRKRGKSYHLDGQLGQCRLRGSLGTRNHDFAQQLLHKVERAIGEGKSSAMWIEVKALIPSSTYTRVANFVGVEEQQELRWSELLDLFRTFMAERVVLGRLQLSTTQRYEITLREFDLFLQEEKVALLSHITKLLFEKFKLWRFTRIHKRKYSRGAAGLVLDVAILHRLFAFAVDSGLTDKNPVQMEGRAGANPTNGAEPFNGEQLARLRDGAGDDLIAFLLLRWTGLRGSDAVSLQWREVHFDRREIERLTQKRKKKVILPIHPELLFALEAEFDRRNPKDVDPVLLNPNTGKNLTRPRLYQRMLALGKRAGVANAHPHRFRDTLAVDMLLRGASPYDVAKMLGDTIATIEQHYTPFVRELRERVRSLLENHSGLENSVTPASQESKRIQ